MTTANNHPPIIKINGHEYRILFPDLLRPLSNQEHYLLRESIRKNGVQVQVIVDNEDGLIDGIHRGRIAEELKIDCPVRMVTGLSYEDKERLAWDLNDCRRTLTPDELVAARNNRSERLQRVAKMRSEGMSTRAIAAEVGVSPTQVHNDIKEATVRDLTVAPPDGKVTGKDGRSRLATMPKPATAEPPPEAPEQAPSSPAVQAYLDRAHPKPETFSLAEFTGHYNAVVASCQAFANDVGSPNSPNLRIIKEHLDEARRGLLLWRKVVNKE